ncbi:hypothetical protein BJY04DRAFT_217828 [Aspergillus karnatakaensis]|uniref:uncharacterized protein n=1 Tax=Aspergillus karnatakaensis TaxID=1810916 RepID=UPI003CCD3ED8
MRSTHILDPDWDVMIVLHDQNSLHDDYTGSTTAESTTSSFEASEDEEQPVRPAVQPEREPVYFLVSAKHLELGSPVFACMFAPTCEEGKTIGSSGTISFDTYGWNADAFNSLLLMLHSQPQKLPARMNASQLLKLSVVADFFDCRELVVHYANASVDLLLTSPRSCSRDAATWMWLGYSSAAPKSSRTLPLPTKLVDALNAGHEQAIESIIASLHTAQQSLLINPLCTWECCAAMLGALVYQMNRNGLLVPRPQAPYLCISHADLKHTVLAFTTPSVESLTHTEHFHIANQAHETVDGTAVFPAITLSDVVALYSPVIWDIEGLELEECIVEPFRPNPIPRVIPTDDESENPSADDSDNDPEDSSAYDTDNDPEDPNLILEVELLALRQLASALLRHCLRLIVVCILFLSIRR